MKPWLRGIVVAIVHCGLVLTVAGKYALDVARLPRVWVKAVPADPDLPIRGRYVSLLLEVDVAPSGTNTYWMPARLAVVQGRLTAMVSAAAAGVHIRRFAENLWMLAEPVAFFIPEHASDPSRRAVGEELWVEVSVPAQGPPRPIRLGVKKNGALSPLAPE